MPPAHVPPRRTAQRVPAGARRCAGGEEANFWKKFAARSFSFSRLFSTTLHGLLLEVHESVRATSPRSIEKPGRAEQFLTSAAVRARITTYRRACSSLLSHSAASS